jgi:hypothetical protein
MQIHLATVCTVVAIFTTACLSQRLRADTAPSDKNQKEIDSAQAELDATVEKIDKRLLSALDREINSARKASALKANERQALVESLTDEKDAFEETRCLPFSMSTRAMTLSYLQDLRRAERKLAKAYDKSIDTAMRAKDDSAAKQLVSQKLKACRHVVGRWTCEGVNFKSRWNLTFYSDGSTNFSTATWDLTESSITLVNKAATAPPGGYIDKIQMKPDGRSFAAKNQAGGVYKG